MGVCIREQGEVVVGSSQGVVVYLCRERHAGECNGIGGVTDGLKTVCNPRDWISGKMRRRLRIGCCSRREARVESRCIG